MKTLVQQMAAEHTRQFDKWMTDTIRPHVPPFLLECVEQRKSLRLVAKYLALKGFFLESSGGVMILCKQNRVLGTFRFHNEFTSTTNH